MRIENYFNLSGQYGFSGLFFVAGSFGIVDGNNEYTQTEENGIKKFTCRTQSVELCSSFEQNEDGVVIRRDSLKNITDTPIEINTLLSRFCLDGNDYDIYTQYNSWLHESTGGWQRLVTQIKAEAQGIRSCDGSAPIMGFHNRYTGKNTVFHLIPNAQWQMTAKKFPDTANEKVVLETGFSNTGLRISVKPCEVINLPEIIFFRAESRTDLDAYKLHRYFNKAYPRKKTPVVYNSWLYCYDDLNIDNLKKQVDTAAEMGIEAFMIDAGWFGNGEDWSSAVGDWTENMTSGPCGRLAELSEHVRQKGMTFGLWFEPERADPKSRAVAEHPDFYINKRVFDFANPDAVSYMLETISAQIEKYNIGWVKFDFNTSIPADPSGNCFYRYLQGQRRFVEGIKEKFPDIYITNCASGGYRMDLYGAQFTDSFWLSDNQGPLGGLDIVKGTLKRMPSACIERWNVQKYADGFPRYGRKDKVGVMFSCNNGTWDSIVAVNPTFVEQFLHGGPFGFSCDIDAFPSEYKERWKEVIAEYKKDREFYQKAEAHILVDSDQISVIEYTDEENKLCIVQIFTKTVYAQDIIVYPVVDKSAKYSYEDTYLDGKDLFENGILVNDLKENYCTVLKLTKE